MRLNGRNRTRLGSIWAPDRNDEYLIYQAALGAWPAESGTAPAPTRAPDELVARLVAYTQKAVREAKVHTSWIDQAREYGRAATAFVERTLTGRTAERFLASFVPFARRLARAGAVNSLAQLTLKLAAPGVPDFYQGSELWDFSLVDPDNRRPVDFALRRRLLDALEPLAGSVEAGRPVAPDVASLLAAWPDGRIKMLLTTCGLRFRRRHAEFMARAAYVPLAVAGPKADQVVAFARSDATGVLVAVAPRLVASETLGGRWPVGAATWGDTAVHLPDDLPAARFRHLVSGVSVDVESVAAGRGLPLARVFETCPFALLWAEPGGRPV
jgi:(1->4)-alpha-D-glucan 1-alpha-D-glucosylmutase